MEVGFDFLLASDGSTFALINCAVPLSAFAVVPGVAPTPEVSVLGRLSPDDGGPAIDVLEGSFFPAPTNRQAKGPILLYQARCRCAGQVRFLTGVRANADGRPTCAAIEIRTARAVELSIALGRSIACFLRGPTTTAPTDSISSSSPRSAPPSATADIRRAWQVYTPGTTSDCLQPARLDLAAWRGETPWQLRSEDAQAAQGYSVELSGHSPARIGSR
jgi:hypothetical protein